MQKAVADAVRRAGIESRQTIRLGTRSRPTSWRTATTSPPCKELLGQKDVHTTMLYTHVPNRGDRAVRSPLDAEGNRQTKLPPAHWRVRPLIRLPPTIADRAS